MLLPKRKRTRLKDYNYSQNGYYFITICTKDRQCTLSTVGVGIPDDPIKLTQTGVIVDNTIKYINNNSGVEINNYVIMPNHVHLIIVINNDNLAEQRVVKDADPYNAAIPKVISSLKRFTNKKSKNLIWQRGYHEHIIRNEYEYSDIYKYILNNPIKWCTDIYYTGQ